MKQVDTPTACNAIEGVQGKRGFNDFTRVTMLASDPLAPAMAGYARTAKFAAVNPPAEPPEVIRERRIAYYCHMAEGPRPVVTVVEDVDFPDCIGAYWGEINTTIQKGLDLSGALTNGVMRDLGDLPDGFPVVAVSVGPSHGFVHVLEIGTPVAIFGRRVNDGDLINADRHGAVVIPADIVDRLGARHRQTARHRETDPRPRPRTGFRSGGVRVRPGLSRSVFGTKGNAI